MRSSTPVLPSHSMPLWRSSGAMATLSIPHPFKPGDNEKILSDTWRQNRDDQDKGQELYIGEVEDMADAILLGTAIRVCRWRIAAPMWL